MPKDGQTIHSMQWQRTNTQHHIMRFPSYILSRTGKSRKIENRLGGLESGELEEQEENF